MSYEQTQQRAPWQMPKMGTGQTATIAPLNTETYSPVKGDYVMAKGYSGGTQQPQSSFKTFRATDGSTQKIYNNNSNSNINSGGAGGMSGMEQFNAGLNTVMGIASLADAWNKNRIARDTYNLNKDMMTKNFNLAKDAYDRRKRRSDNISRQLAGESYESVYADQKKFDDKKKDKKDK